MNADTQTPSPQVSEHVAQYIADYTPTIPAKQWVPVAAICRNLVIATVPPTTNDAKVCLSHTARYMAWVFPRAGTLDAGTVVSAEWIERYCRENPGRLGAGSLSKQREILRRVLRASQGDVACTRREPAAQGAAPYSAAELASLRIGAVPGGALEVALSAAIEGSALAVGAVRDRDDTRREAARAGVQMSFRRLRATSIAITLQQRGTVHAAIVAGGVTRNALDRILPHLPRPDEDITAALLRG